MSSLREMGAGSASEIQALTELSDEELDKYVQLWQEKNAEAKEEATLQLKELKSETQKGISELRNNASEQLTLYENEWKTKNETIKNDTITQLQAMVNQAQIQGNAFVVTLATAIQQAMPELYDALSGIPGVGAITGQKGENSQVGEAEAQRDGVVSATNQQNTAVINSTAIATQTVLKTWQDAGAVMNETHNVIREQTLTIWNDIYAKITTLWAKFLADTKKTWTEQQVFILEVLTTIQNKFNELVLKSETWGVSLMSGFIKGIKSKKQDLIETLEEMTATVDQYMPQSPAEKGALSKLDKYGPAFVNTFAEGITSSIPVLEKAMSALTMSAVPVMSSGAGNTTTTTSTSTANSFTITLNGKDDEALLSNLMRELHKRGVKF
jgi:hypothetical protein